jgi:hypothetical protein
MDNDLEGQAAKLAAWRAAAKLVLILTAVLVKRGDLPQAGAATLLSDFCDYALITEPGLSDGGDFTASQLLDLRDRLAG